MKNLIWKYTIITTLYRIPVTVEGRGERETQISLPSVQAVFSFPHQISLRWTKRKGIWGHQNLDNESQGELCAREPKTGLVLKTPKDQLKVSFGMCVRDKCFLIKYGQPKEKVAVPEFASGSWILKDTWANLIETTQRRRTRWWHIINTTPRKTIGHCKF